MSFRKDLGIFGDKDEICPHCHVKFVVDAVTPEGLLFGEFNDVLDLMMDSLCFSSHNIISSSNFEEIQNFVEEQTLFEEEEKRKREEGMKPVSEEERVKAEKRRAKILAKKRGKK